MFLKYRLMNVIACWDYTCTCIICLIPFTTCIKQVLHTNMYDLCEILILPKYVVLVFVCL